MQKFLRCLVFRFGAVRRLRRWPGPARVRFASVLLRQHQATPVPQPAGSLVGAQLPWLFAREKQDSFCFETSPSWAERKNETVDPWRKAVSNKI